MRNFIITDYIESAMEHAEYAILEDNTFSGRIPLCSGVIAFGNTLKETETELRSTLEDWILTGLKLGHHFEDIDGISLNQEIENESIESMQEA